MKRLLLMFTCSILLGATASHGAKRSNPPEAYNHYLKALLYESQGNIAVAKEELNRALALTPDSAYLLRAHAEMCLRLGQLPEARESIEKALLLDPKDYTAFILAGQISWALGDPDKAEAHLGKAVQLAPDEAEPLVNLATAVTPKDPKKAVKLYEDFLTRHPGDVDIQERLAQLYQSLGNIQMAKQSWDKVLEVAPDSMRAHLASAQIAEISQDTMTAIAHYEAVLGQDPTNLPLLLRVGELRYRNDEMAKAHEAFSKAQSIAPNSTSANFWMALLKEHEGNWNEAIQLLKQVADKTPEPGVLLRLSYYYSQAGKKKEAIGVLKRLSDEEPENIDFLNYLSLAYEQDGQYVNAEKAVLKLINIDPTNPEHYFHLATIYDHQKKFPKAEEALKKSIELDPEFHMALNYLAYSYAERNIHLDEAETMLHTAIALEPQNAAYLDSMGWTYFRMGKFRKAEDFLKEAALKAQDALIFDHLADVQMAQGDRAGAIFSWDRALRLDPQQKGVDKKLAKALAKLSLGQRLAVGVIRASATFGHLDSVKGLSKVAVCEKNRCADVRAQFKYERQSEMRVEVPGPLGAPLMLVVKSAGKPVQFGSVHPQVQTHEGDVKRAFERIASLLSADALTSLKNDQLESTAKTDRGGIVGLSGSTRVRINGKSGRIEAIEWGGSDLTERLRMEGAGKGVARQFPMKLIWTNLTTHREVRVELVDPLISLVVPRPTPSVPQ